jgi:hypothetical protein
MDSYEIPHLTSELLCHQSAAMGWHQAASAAPLPLSIWGDIDPFRMM